MIALEGVGRVHQSGVATVVALHDVDLEVARGEFVAVIGPSGSGKSTLLNLIGCLDRPTSGRLLFQGTDVATLGDRQLSTLRNRSVGFVFQSYNLVPELTVRENVELPLVYARRRPAERMAAAMTALESVHLGDRAAERAAFLSGGEQQRVAVARALVNDPDVILADEPTGSIDASSAAAVMDLLHGLNREGRTVLVVTHHPAVASHAARAVRLVEGAVITDAAA